MLSISPCCESTIDARSLKISLTLDMSEFMARISTSRSAMSWDCTWSCVWTTYCEGFGGGRAPERGSSWDAEARVEETWDCWWERNLDLREDSAFIRSSCWQTAAKSFSSFVNTALSLAASTLSRPWRPDLASLNAASARPRSCATTSRRTSNCAGPAEVRRDTFCWYVWTDWETPRREEEWGEAEKDEEEGAGVEEVEEVETLGGCR
mmetsp:Transcript_23507/g.46771  ORF Transcript_23507/g.46771 Transcript_23507/m.46771 type:complete len:208 (-) Transcript_23507:138-761(-)